MSIIFNNGLPYRPAAYPEMITRILGTSVMMREVEKIPGAKPDVVLHYGSVSSSWREYDCAPTSCGGLAFSQKTITACEWQKYGEICKRTLGQIWDQQGMFSEPAGFNPVTYAEGVFNWFIDRVVEEGDEEIDLLAWQGDKNLPVSECGEPALYVCDGFYKLFLADPQVIDIATPVGGYNEANILAALKALWLATPAEVKNNRGAQQSRRIYAPIQVRELLQARYAEEAGVFQGTAGAPGANVLGLSANGTDELGYLNYYYQNIPIVFTRGMLDDTMVLTTGGPGTFSNLVAPLDVESDFANVSILDHFPTQHRDVMSFKITARLGWNYKRGDLIVLQQ